MMKDCKAALTPTAQTSRGANAQVFTVAQSKAEANPSAITDGFPNEKGARARLLLESPEGNSIRVALRFRLVASNNQAEYEALLIRIRLAKEMGAMSIKIYSDSQLVVHQIFGEYKRIRIGWHPISDR
ncbi:uncharacterized protein LOC116139091 [Pistacia vera]|uniref:uncharacterized protein LOC116139091 n=1 Tax=Pistacia vera TaxID=55513 RepID=UPI0012631178|nr:uncharacterized protein LOC116139091 [Pistacia vera]